MLTTSFILENEQETFLLGERMGQKAQPGEVWCLAGPLGAGKTLWVKGFAQGLEFRGPVTSPTFALQHIYEGRHNLYHFDWYRLESAREVEEIGWAEWLGRGGVVVVEWGDKFPSLLPASAIKLTLEMTAEGGRRAIVEAQHPEGMSRVEELVRCWPP